MLDRRDYLELFSRTNDKTSRDLSLCLLDQAHHAYLVGTTAMTKEGGWIQRPRDELRLPKDGEGFPNGCLTIRSLTEPTSRFTPSTVVSSYEVDEA